MTLLRVCSFLLAVGLSAGCGPATSTQSTVSASPIASTSAAAPDNDGVIARFTNDIWPAVEGYRWPGQGSPAYKRFVSIVAPDRFSAAHEAAVRLGKVYNSEGYPVSGPDAEHGLKLVDTALTSLESSIAVISTCYTYPSFKSGDTTGTPSASEATFELRKTDTWYLWDITNDHVVSGCSASDRA